MDTVASADTLPEIRLPRRLLGLAAFDFFILVFVIKDIAKEFQVDKTHVTFAIFLTLAFRPVGAFLFGWAGEWGVGASLEMESVPPKTCGLLSGILQQG